MKWIYADRIEVALDANGNETDVITEEDREKQRMLREKPENSLVELCKEYDFDIVNKQPQKDETPVEVQFHGITKTMPRWKAEEFANKLNEIGFAPIIDGVVYTEFLNMRPNYA